MIQRQLELEKEMVGIGIKRYRDAVISNREKGMESNSPYGVKLTAEFIIPIVTKIEGFLDRSAKRAGTKHRASKYLRGMDLDVVAFLTCKSIIDSISQVKTLTSCALLIGAALETQQKFLHFEKQNPSDSSSAVSSDPLE